LEENKITVTGNLKFSSLDADEKYLSAFRERYFHLVKKPNKLLIIAASTHFPEEEIFLEIYEELSRKYTNITLMLAPRHIERTSYLEALLASGGYRAIKISEPSPLVDSKSIYILDTVGDLFYFYSLADICFVGGSLANFGGHNILEPLYFLKPTIFGPFMHNFKEIEKKVLQRSAAVKVNNIEELKKVLEMLIKDPKFRKELSMRALGIFEEEKVNLKKNLELVLRYLE
jgi:3-deoxy-D-manno-octulosonic-acid transferase